MLYDMILYYSIFVIYCMILSCIVLCCIVIVLYYLVLHCFVLYCIVLYCTVLYCIFYFQYPSDLRLVKDTPAYVKSCVISYQPPLTSTMSSGDRLKQRGKSDDQ